MNRMSLILSLCLAVTLCSAKAAHNLKALQKKSPSNVGHGGDGQVSVSGTWSTAADWSSDDVQGPSNDKGEGQASVNGQWSAEVSWSSDEKGQVSVGGQWSVDVDWSSDGKDSSDVQAPSNEKGCGGDGGQVSVSGQWSVEVSWSSDDKEGLSNGNGPQLPASPEMAVPLQIFKAPEMIKALKASTAPQVIKDLLISK